MATPVEKSDKALPTPSSPPEAFFSPRRVWKHIRTYRETYLDPLVSIIVLVLAIHGVRLLTGRAVVDDPGAIIAALYNAVIIVFGISIWGKMQGHQIPDIDENQPGLTWQMHAINCLCNCFVFFIILYFLFSAFQFGS